MEDDKSGCRLVAMALVLGTSYREFESRHPDHFIRPTYFIFLDNASILSRDS